MRPVSEPLPALDLKSIRFAAEIISSDGLVAFPTETVYGLGERAESRRSDEDL
jgi:tRNA A37 threonylcarbamoyladenosine synthetase subunit TsaC/SUA5/YrdC